MTLPKDPMLMKYSIMNSSTMEALYLDYYLLLLWLAHLVALI